MSYFFRIDFSPITVASDGSYCLQVLTKLFIWYIINDNLTIN